MKEYKRTIWTAPAVNNQPIKAHNSPVVLAIIQLVISDTPPLSCHIFVKVVCQAYHFPPYPAWMARWLKSIIHCHKKKEKRKRNKG